jgi:hypothetical protein
MHHIARLFASASNAPRSAPVTSTPSTVLHIGPVYWTVPGFGCALNIIGGVLATCFFCGLLGLLVRLVGMVL